MHAGRAVQGVDADAGVVGKRRQPRVLARVTRLGECVLDKREMRLVGLGHAERRLRDDLDVERREDGADLVQLADVVGSDDDFVHELNLKS